jgi:hypothetical protein
VSLGTVADTSFIDSAPPVGNQTYRVRSVAGDGTVSNWVSKSLTVPTPPPGEDLRIASVSMRVNSCPGDILSAEVDVKNVGSVASDPKVGAVQVVWPENARQGRSADLPSIAPGASATITVSPPCGDITQCRQNLTRVPSKWLVHLSSAPPDNSEWTQIVDLPSTLCDNYPSR